MSFELSTALESAAAAVSRTSTTDADQLAKLTDLARETLTDFEYASVSVREADDLRTIASTDAVTDGFDSLQGRFREGPCYDAVTEDRLVVSSDVASDPRWPRYGPAVAEAGIRTQFAVQLSPRPHERASLNFYARRDVEVTRDMASVAEMFATLIAHVLGYQHVVEEMDRGLQTRTRIGTAIGILMERYQMPESRAFAVLVRASQEANIKLRDVAQRIVDEIPREPAS